MSQLTEVIPSYARLTVEKQEKITFIKNKEIDETNFNLPENRISAVDKIVKLRGGDMNSLTKALFRLILIWASRSRVL